MEKQTDSLKVLMLHQSGPAEIKPRTITGTPLVEMVPIKSMNSPIRRGEFPAGLSGSVHVVHGINSRDGITFPGEAFQGILH